MRDSTYRVLRNCMGLSVEVMARKCKVSAVYYSELERGVKQHPSDEVLQNIAVACGLKLDTMRFLVKHGNCETLRKHLVKQLDNIVKGGN